VKYKTFYKQTLTYPFSLKVTSSNQYLTKFASEVYISIESDKEARYIIKKSLFNIKKNIKKKLNVFFIFVTGSDELNNFPIIQTNKTFN